MGVKYPVIDIKSTGRNIRRIMLARGLTVKDVQNYLGLGTPQGIYHWFAGRNLPSLDNFYALARFFGVTVDDMLVGTLEGESCFTGGSPDILIQECTARICTAMEYYKRAALSYRLYAYYRRMMQLKAE